MSKFHGGPGGGGFERMGAEDKRSSRRRGKPERNNQEKKKGGISDALGWSLHEIPKTVSSSPDSKDLSVGAPAVSSRDLIRRPGSRTPIAGGAAEVDEETTRVRDIRQLREAIGKRASPLADELREKEEQEEQYRLLREALRGALRRGLPREIESAKRRFLIFASTRLVEKKSTAEAERAAEGEIAELEEEANLAAQETRRKEKYSVASFESQNLELVSKLRDLFRRMIAAQGAKGDLGALTAERERLVAEMKNLGESDEHITLILNFLANDERNKFDAALAEKREIKESHTAEISRRMGREAELRAKANFNIIASTHFSPNEKGELEELSGEALAAALRREEERLRAQGVSESEINNIRDSGKRLFDLQSREYRRNAARKHFTAIGELPIKLLPRRPAG